MLRFDLENISIRTFQEIFQGKTFQAQLSRHNFPGKKHGWNWPFFRTCDAARGSDRYPGAPWGQDKELDALLKSETCAVQRSFWAVTPHHLPVLLTHTHTVLLGLHVESVKTVRVGPNFAPKSALQDRVSLPWTDLAQCISVPWLAEKSPFQDGSDDEEGQETVWIE